MKSYGLLDISDIMNFREKLAKWIKGTPKRFPIVIKVPPNYKAGARVSEAKYGKGTVKEIELRFHPKTGKFYGYAAVIKFDKEEKERIFSAGFLDWKVKE